MRKLVTAGFLLVAFVLAVPTANASTHSRTKAHRATLSMKAQITSFRATPAGVVANGDLIGTLRSSTGVSRDRAPVKFAVVAKAKAGQCNVLTLHLAPLDLELLGVQVTTSTINLNITAVKGRVLGNLFCALANAKVTFPKMARDVRALNSRLTRHSMRVFTATESIRGRLAQATSCQVLKLVLGPLHLDLLGLVVDLYGQTTSSPVVVTITADPSKGLLGQLLCGLAGGTGVTSLGSLQSLLNSLGVNLSLTQIQNLLNQLGITNLSSGLTQLDLQRILHALGLGSATPSG
jgi:hypothetical protein